MRLQSISDAAAFNRWLELEVADATPGEVELRLEWRPEFARYVVICTRASSVRAFALSFAVGLLVGVLYAGLRVKSPAPPLIAPTGLLGMVLGEQALPLVAGLFARVR